MAISGSKDTIITLPNPHLRQRSKRVGVITEQIHAIVDAMQSATLDWENGRDHEVGVALAAVQIDELLRIVIVRSNPENKKDRLFQVFINPSITKPEGKMIEDFEGCLSIKNIYGKVPRYSKVRVKALDMDGNEFRVTAEGFLARVFQHEIDHMNGTVFIDHIKDKPSAFYRLTKEGNLEELDYEKDVKNNKDLWK